MKLQNRQQLLAIVAGAAIALWAGDRLIFSPLVKWWKARSTRIVDLRKSLRQGNFIMERDRSIRARWDNMRASTLPLSVSAAESRVFRAFERWSQDSQISITSIKPQWKKTSDDYSTLECRVDAYGNLQTLTKFLYNVEKHPAPGRSDEALALKIDSVEITTRDNDGQQLTLGLQVSALQFNPSP